MDFMSLSSKNIYLNFPYKEFGPPISLSSKNIYLNFIYKE
jgi:hypothetical protein